MMGNTQIVTIELRHENAGLGTRSGWKLSNQVNLIRITFLKHLEKIGCGKVNPLLLGIECHVIDHGGSRKDTYHFSRVRVQRHQVPRISRADKQAVRGFIECDCAGLLSLLRKAPGGQQGTVAAVKNLNRAVSSYVDEKAGP